MPSTCPAAQGHSKLTGWTSCGRRQLGITSAGMLWFGSNNDCYLQMCMQPPPTALVALEGRHTWGPDCVLASKPLPTL